MSVERKAKFAFDSLSLLNQIKSIGTPGSPTAVSCEEVVSIPS